MNPSGNRTKQGVNLKKLSILLVLFTALTGCYGMFSARTIASYEVIDADGKRRIVRWDSNQEQTNLNATFDANGASVKVEKAGTLESLATGLLQLHSQILQRLDSIAKVASSAGAGS